MSDINNSENIGKTDIRLSLSDERVQEKLVDTIFGFYRDDLWEILDVATVENVGVRPQGVTNEIFSCFHHLVRGLCAGQNTDAVLTEIDSANKHLRRAVLDCYKIAVYPTLREDNQLKEILNYLNVAEEFERFVPNGVQKITEINRLSRAFRNAYVAARHQEKLGNFETAVDKYNKTLELADDVRNAIHDVTENQQYLVACAVKVKEQKDKVRDRWSVIVASAISSLFGAIGGGIIVALIQWGCR